MQSKRLCWEAELQKDVYKLFTNKVNNLAGVPAQQNKERSSKVAEPNKLIPGQFHLSHYKQRRRRSHRRKEVWTYLNAQSHLNWPQVRCVFFFFLQNTSIRFSTRQNLLVEHQCTSVLLHGLVQHARSIIKRIHYSDRLNLSCTPLKSIYQYLLTGALTHQDLW